MADELEFKIVANADQVNKTLADLKSHSKEIQDGFSLGDFTDEGDGLNKMVNDLAQLNQELTKMKGASHRGTSILGRSAQLPGVKKELDDLKKETDNAVKEYNKAADILRDTIDSGFKLSPQGSYRDSKGANSRVQSRNERDKAISKAGSSIRNSNTTRGNYSPPEEYGDYENLKTRVGDIKNQRTQYVKTGDIARGKGSMTFAQSKRYQQSTRDFTSEYQGIDMEEAQNLITEGKTIRDVDPDSVSPDSVRGQSIELQKGMEQYKSELQDELTALDLDRNLPDDEVTNRANEIAEQVDLANKMVDKAQEMISVLDNGFNSTISEMQEMQQDAAVGGDIRVAPDPDSTRGKMNSRANVVALAAVAAGTYSAASKFSQGRSESESMRPTSQSIGYRTGEDDFRSIRTDAMMTGRDYGYSGGEVLDMADTILGSRGTTNDEDLQNATVGAIEFSKFSGATEGTATELTSTLSSTGASTTTVSDIQSAILGGIKASGMQGREEEQISALNGIVQNQKQGFNVTDNQLQGRVAMANVLSQSGGRAFQGEGLSDFFGSTDSAIRGSDMWSDTGLLLGAGTEFQGPGAMYDYEVMTDQGLTPETFNKLVSNMQLSGVQDPNMIAAGIENMLGLEVDTAAFSNIIEQSMNGSLSEESLQSQLDSTQQTGDTQLDENSEAYQESPDSARDMDAANDVIKAINTYENSATDLIAEISRHTSKIGTGGGLQATLTTGLGSFAGSFGGSILGDLGAGALSSLMTRLFSSGDNPMGSMGKTLKGDPPTGTGGGGGLFSKIGGAFAGNTLFQGAKGLGKNVLTKGKGLLGNGINTAKNLGGNLANTIGGSRIGKFFSGPGGGSKLGAVAGGAFRGIKGFNDVKEAEEGEKGRATGEAVGGTAGTLLGGLGGAAGGAALGAKVGTLAGGPVGTAIGGLLGLAGGTFGSWLGDQAGTGLGGGIGGGIDSLLNRDTEPEENLDTEKTEESADESQSMRQERLRQSNTSLETNNIDRQEVALKEARQLLSDASSQNGILGATSNGGLADGSRFVKGKNTTATPIGGLNTDRDLTYLEESVPDYIKNWSQPAQIEPLRRVDESSYTNGSNQSSTNNKYGDVNINVQVDYSGTGDESDMTNLGNIISTQINERFYKEMKPI